MHFMKARGILSAKNGMNLYRGCQHGCIYCDARSRCYQMDHVFEDIEVKENALELLKAALISKRRPCMIGTGAMTDPYMPLEEELQMTRRALELIASYGFGIAIQTKSARILRDLDLLVKINQQAKAVVQITLTTMDEALCKITEPNVSATKERIGVLKACQAAGIPTVVWLCPILPFLNDTEENLLGILQACRDTGVKGIVCFGMGLTLREGNREYYYAKLDRHFPGLKERYIRTYGNAYDLPSPNHRHLERLFREFCDGCGIWHDPEQIFAYMRTLEEREPQLRFF